MKFNVVGKFDVIIIGSGISGLICAIELAKAGKTVCILTKEAVTESSSLYAQGGIAVPLSKLDSVEKHLEDTIKAGAGLSNFQVAKDIIQYSQAALDKLISYGVKFDLDNKKNIALTKEAAHTFGRVCHVGGDASGRFITKILIDKACREPNISISQGTIALKILRDTTGSVCGILAGDVTKENYVLLSRDLIIASGGIGQLYKYTTNPLVCTADGIVMAYLLGASLQDVEMVQFHPTVLLNYGEPLLISEAVRGEGTRLKNVHGEYFALKYHELAELAPRDVLARAIFYEMERTKSNFVYLDLTNFDKNYFENRFPNIYKSCVERKINLFGEGIPVAPGAHYSIGGIKCALDGSTGFEGLWVLGEAASNGFHGANRLASNSLLECITAPHFLVKGLLGKKPKSIPKLIDFEIEVDSTAYDDNFIKNLIQDLQLKNTLSLGVVRGGSGLRKHLENLREISAKLNVNFLSTNYQAQELKNMILLSEIISIISFERKHSIGAHFRKDFPQKPHDFNHSVYSMDKGLLWELEVPPKQLVSVFE